MCFQDVLKKEKKKRKEAGHCCMTVYGGRGWDLFRDAHARLKGKVRRERALSVGGEKKRDWNCLASTSQCQNLFNHGIRRVPKKRQCNIPASKVPCPPPRLTWHVTYRHFMTHNTFNWQHQSSHPLLWHFLEMNTPLTHSFKSSQECCSAPSN